MATIIQRWDTEANRKLIEDAFDKAFDGLQLIEFDKSGKRVGAVFSREEKIIYAHICFAFMRGVETLETIGVDSPMFQDTKRRVISIGDICKSSGCSAEDVHELYLRSVIVKYNSGTDIELTRSLIYATWLYLGEHRYDSSSIPSERDYIALYDPPRACSVLYEAMEMAPIEIDDETAGELGLL